MAPALASQPLLLAVPNVSEGRDAATIGAIARAFTAHAAGGGEERPAGWDTGAGESLDTGEGAGAGRGGPVLLDVHSDVDHHRSVYTLAGWPSALVEALLEGAAETVGRVDVMADAGRARGEHPHVGALDVAPIVYPRESARGTACAWALVLADRLGQELGVPVFLYGELGAGRTRAQIRAGGVARLAQRIQAGELRPDFGPARLHRSAGATLVAARPPLVAFNLQLAPPATLAEARRIAGLIREGGPEGLPGLRAIGVELSGGVGQVSMNVERPFETPLALILERVRRHAPVASGELVGLAPRAALEGFPRDVPLPGFDPARHLIESALG
jgi:glutamate formiminotransferase/glutamate formiminotransferase/formiminotetrahydrofolate cyclodeaminase